MSIRIGLLLTAVLLFAALTASADKKKNLLPATVPKARTVLVLIDPDAGISVTDPAVNKTARDDVEQAIYELGGLLPRSRWAEPRPDHRGFAKARAN